MNAEQLIGNLATHLVMQVAPRLTDPIKKFKIGLFGGGVGRRPLVEKVAPFLAEFTGADGEIDLAALRQAVNAGFDVAHKVPVAELGIEIDATDAAAFFDSLPQQ